MRRGYLRGKMIAVLLLLSLLPGATALALPGGPPECLKGPEFWCRDVATAAQCGRLQFCLVYGWDELPEGADERHPLVICWMCRTFIDGLKAMVPNTHDTRGVGKAIKKICSTVFYYWSDQCHEVVDQYVTPIEDGLAQDLEPHEICIKIGMCESQGHPGWKVPGPRRAPAAESPADTVGPAGA
ncbi:prosaposin-like [Chrysemys picta bellii]|uniref:prosaposin-like n=1 Tax=Chrysemys picta bellii TaxID=8478 RepID=UPI0032B1A40E